MLTSARVLLAHTDRALLAHTDRALLAHTDQNHSSYHVAVQQEKSRERQGREDNLSPGLAEGRCEGAGWDPAFQIKVSLSSHDSNKTFYAVTRKAQ